jgi:hypothetical protein
MKKTYMKPSAEVVRMGMTMMICTSEGVTSNNGIDYGGVDEDGEKDPAARRHRNVWDDEEDMEEDW